MCKKLHLFGLFLTICISCEILACSEKTCDDVQIDVCNGNFIVTDCLAGEIIQHNCKDLSPTAICGMFKKDEYGVTHSEGYPRCYEPCTTKDEKKTVCIDHTSDSDKDYESSFCILQPGSTKCIDIPTSQRPDSYREDVCKHDESGILYWERGYEEECYNYASINKNKCCSKEGKLCSTHYAGFCEENTNTAVFCNRNNLVEHKSCNDFGAGYTCYIGVQCCNDSGCKDI